MNQLWKIAAVQMDCKLGDKQQNLDAIRSHVRQAAEQGARLIVFPECALTGYCFESKEEAMEFAEPLPGPSTVDLALTCRQFGVWIVYGLLERDGDRLFNACALVGPDGLVATYRKVHLPFLGVDRFTTPGDRPFAVHDLGGLKVGLNICYDGSFPEPARVMTLQGADLIVLPTNWPTGAEGIARHGPNTRALENHIYYAAVDRIGQERGFTFIGQSQLVDCFGRTQAGAGADKPEILYADVDPAQARQKKVVRIAGKFEVNPIGDRRPEMYGLIAKAIGNED